MPTLLLVASIDKTFVSNDMPLTQPVRTTLVSTSRDSVPQAILKESSVIRVLAAERYRLVSVPKYIPPVAAVVSVQMVKTPLAGTPEGPTASWLAVVLTTSRLVPAAFWTAKPVVELVAFCRVKAPAPLL